MKGNILLCDCCHDNLGLEFLPDLGGFFGHAHPCFPMAMD
jgi:hypothetical protein